MGAPLTQAGGPSNIDEVLTNSLANLIPGIRDNVFKSNPVLAWMMEKNGGKMKLKGGAALSHGLLYERNTTAQSYQRYDILDVTPQDGQTRDMWDWAQYSASVAIDGFNERVANAGASKIEDVLETKKMQAEESLKLLLEQHLFAASPGTKDIRSLATIVASSGTEGDINATTSSWWASNVVSSGAFATQGRADLTSAWNTMSMINPVGGPELIVSSQTEFQFYETSLAGNERFIDTKLGDAGFQNLKFKNTPWVFSPQATVGTIYLLHSAGIEFAVNADTDFVVTPFVKPANQDAKVSQILVACALMSGNRRKLGKLTGVTA
jgi:hypothetical protein